MTLIWACTDSSLVGTFTPKPLNLWKGSSNELSSKTSSSHLSSSLLEEHKSSHKSLHLGLPLAASSAALQLGHPISLLSFSAVLLQVSLGLPPFRLPSDVQVRATFWFSLFPFLSTCRMYRYFLIYNMLSSIVWVWVLSLRIWLLISFSQNTRNILLRHLFWNASHFFMSATVIFQHSDPCMYQY